MAIENVREHNFNAKYVIDGLNGYYEDKQTFIRVYRDFGQGPIYLDTGLWLSALIEWLREDHDIFYRPGLIFDQVEAARNAAKMCCLRAHIKDEMSKRGLWCTAEEDIPELVDTLFKAYDECSKARDRNRKDATKLSEVTQELRKELNTLKDTVSKVRSRLNSKFIPLPGYEDDLEKLVDIALRGVEARDETINHLTRPWHDEYKDLMDYIRQEVSRNGYKLLEEIGEPLTVKRVFHDLLELLVKRTAEIREVNDQRWEDLRDIHKALGCDGMNGHIDDFAKAVKARASVIKSEHDRYLDQLGKAAADYQALSEENQKLKSSQKSDINKLIRDCCVKHDVIAPSRYFSDETCVEYLFSLIEQKDRSFTILQELYRDIFKKQPDGLSAEDIANKILDRVLTTEDLLHKSVDSVNKKCKATGRMMVADYEKDLLNFIYKGYEGRIHLSDKIITYNPPSVHNTITKIIRDYARSRTRVDILETKIKSIFDKCKSEFTVDDYMLNSDPTTSFMLDCIGSWISSPAESRGKIRAEIENYKLKLKDYILHDIKKHGYRYDGLETKSIEDIVDWIITMETCDRSSIALRDIYTTVERLRHNIDDCDGEIVGHMKDYILRRFEGLHSNTEYCLKKMSELDGCKKDLKILEDKVTAKDDEISRLKDLINAMNEEVKNM